MIASTDMRAAVISAVKHLGTVRHISTHGRIICWWSKSYSNRFSTISHERLQQLDKEYVADSDWLKTAAGSRVLHRFLQHPPASTISASDMRDYLQQRGLHKFLNEENQMNNLVHAERILSYLLTYPLSLARGISGIFPTWPASSSNALNILVVGARSEYSLPLMWWKELLYAQSNIEQMNLRMIGPGVQSHNNKSLIKASGDSCLPIKQTNDHKKIWINPSNNHEYHVNLVNSSSEKVGLDGVYLHDHAQMNDLLRWAHCFVMFNPGFGSEEHIQSWNLSMRAMLETKKPILATAHSEDDLLRDLGCLGQLNVELDDQELGEAIEFILKPSPNPFASHRPLVSRVVQQAERKHEEVITTNHSLYAFQML